MYPIGWDVVFKYTDVDAGTYNTYQFSVQPVPPLGNEAEIQGKKYVEIKPGK